MHAGSASRPAADARGKSGGSGLGGGGAVGLGGDGRAAGHSPAMTHRPDAWSKSSSPGHAHRETAVGAPPGASCCCCCGCCGCCGCTGSGAAHVASIGDTPVRYVRPPTQLGGDAGGASGGGGGVGGGGDGCVTNAHPLCVSSRYDTWFGVDCCEAGPYAAKVSGSNDSIDDTPTHTAAFATHTRIACSSNVADDPAKTDPTRRTPRASFPKHDV